VLQRVRGADKFNALPLSRIWTGIAMECLAAALVVGPLTDGNGFLGHMVIAAGSSPCWNYTNRVNIP